MAKEVMILTPEEIKQNCTLTASDAETLRWLASTAGVEMDETATADYVLQRNARASSIRNLLEFKAWAEKAAGTVKELVKHAMNEGTAEELPQGFAWSKQSFTYEFQPGAGHIVAQDLVERGLVTIDALLDCITPTALAKAAGITTDKMVEQFGDAIVEKPKERTLKVK